MTPEWRRRTIAGLAALLALAAAASLATPQATHGAVADPLPLPQVATWAYQIQGLSRAGAVDALAASHYDLLVLEPSRTEKGNGDFATKAMVARLKATPAGDGSHRKLVLAYLSIGEAESWRWYWTWSTRWPSGSPRPRDWPGFIVARDPDGWGGCYPVAYWSRRWKDIAIYGAHTGTRPGRDYTSIVDEAIRDGFDGVYLDWVEAYELPAVVRAARRAGKNPRAEMVRFLAELRDYARQRDPSFVIVQQNASTLWRRHPELFGIVDGIAQEGIWYYGAATDSWSAPSGHDIPTPASWRADYLGNLGKFRAAGLPVLDVEYTVRHAAGIYERSRGYGFVPYCSRSPLSRLTTTPPLSYSN